METPLPNERLSALLDNELGDSERRALEKELESDASLRAELESLRRARELLRTHGKAYAPADFVDQVMGKLENEPIPVNNTLAWRRPFGIPIEALAVAAVALIVAFGGLSTGVVLVGNQAVDSVMTKEAPSEPMAATGEGADAELPSEMAPPLASPAKTDPVKPGAPSDLQEKGNAAGGTGRYEDKKEDLPRAAAEGKTSKDATYDTLSMDPVPPAPQESPYRADDPATSPPQSRGAEEEMVADSVTMVPAAEAPKAETKAPKKSKESAPATSSSGMIPEMANAWPESGWAFRLVTTNGAVVGDLNGIAKKFGGTLRDSALNVVNAGSLQTGDAGTYYIEIDGKKLPDLERSLRSFGATVDRQGGKESGKVLVRVSVLVIVQQR